MLLKSCLLYRYLSNSRDSKKFIFEKNVSCVVGVKLFSIVPVLPVEAVQHWLLSKFPKVFHFGDSIKINSAGSFFEVKFMKV